MLFHKSFLILVFSFIVFLKLLLISFLLLHHLVEKESQFVCFQA